MASKGNRTASELIRIARSYEGYREKASNSKLNDFTANAGSNNYTMFADMLYKAGYYNGNKNGYSWCDVFVDAMFYLLCDKDKAAAESMECQTGVLGAGCTYSAQYYQGAGRYDGNPKVGDQIFFRNGTERFTHTGIVIEVTSSTVKVIEGNHDNKVGIWEYQRKSSAIEGYGHPKYDAENDKMTTVSVRELKKGMTGNDVYFLQCYLSCSKLYKSDLDGQFGPLTEAAVIAYQKSKFPNDKTEWDGIVGPNTYGKLFTK